MSDITSFFSPNFRRSCMEAKVVQPAEVAAFIEKSTNDQIQAARERGLREATVLIAYPEEWRNGHNDTVLSCLVSEMASRFAPIQIIWGDNSWHSIPEDEVLEHSFLFKYDFRFTLLI